MVFIAAADILPAVLGAAVGAIVTAFATWWVSRLLDVARERRRLRGALQVVLAELADNRGRIEAASCENLDERAERDAQESLTLDDWGTNKATVAVLESMNRPLWKKLVTLYGRIYTAKSHRMEGLPLAKDLTDVEDLLHGEVDALRVHSLQPVLWRLRRWWQQRRAPSRI